MDRRERCKVFTQYRRQTNDSYVIYKLLPLHSRLVNWMMIFQLQGTTIVAASVILYNNMPVDCNVFFVLRLHFAVRGAVCNIKKHPSWRLRQQQVHMTLSSLWFYRHCRCLPFEGSKYKCRDNTVSGLHCLTIQS